MIRARRRRALTPEQARTLGAGTAYRATSATRNGPLKAGVPTGGGCPTHDPLEEDAQVSLCANSASRTVRALVVMVRINVWPIAQHVVVPPNAGDQDGDIREAPSHKGLVTKNASGTLLIARLSIRYS